MLRIFLLFFLIFQNSLLTNYAQANIDLENPFYKLGWKNLQNPQTSVVEIPGTNAVVEILDSEIYLNKKEDIKKYLEYQKGIEINLDEIDKVFIISEREEFYTIEIEYDDTGYVTSDRFKNFTPDDIMKTMIENNPEPVLDLKWILKPTYSENNISTYGYRVDWKDGDISYEYEGLVFGREGYFKVKYATFGDGNETNEYFDYYESLVNGVSESIIFNNGYTYADFTDGDWKSIYTVTNIIDGTYGTGNATDPTVQLVNCLVTPQALKKGGITEDDYPRFAGKVIVLLITDVRKEIADISQDDEVSVITGAGERLKYTVNGNNLSYTNVVELKGDTENDIVKYEYKNRVLFENKKPKLFYANIDQTGFSFNEWKLVFGCRDYDYTEDEIAKAGEISGKPELKDLIKKLEKRKTNN